MFLRFHFFLIKHAIFTDSTGAVNSSLGVDKNFFGVTQDLLTNKPQCIFPSPFTNFMYLHWPYLFSEVSKKWWRLIFMIFPNMWGLIQLDMCISSTPFNLCSHLSQSFLSSGPTTSSHCTCCTLHFNKPSM